MVHSKSYTFSAHSHFDLCPPHPLGSPKRKWECLSRPFSFHPRAIEHQATDWLYLPNFSQMLSSLTPLCHHCCWTSIMSFRSFGSLLTSLLLPRGICVTTGMHRRPSHGPSLSWVKRGKDFVQNHTTNQRQRQAGTQPCCPWGLGTFQHLPCLRVNLWMFLEGILPPEVWGSLSTSTSWAQNMVSIRKEIVARGINKWLLLLFSLFQCTNLPFK